MAIYNSVFQVLEAHVHEIDNTISMEPGNIANALDKLTEAYADEYEIDYEDTNAAVRSNAIADKLDLLLKVCEAKFTEEADEGDEGGTDTPAT